MKFSELNAHPSLRRAIEEKGYDQPTSVQEAVLAAGSEDADLLVSAATGSGKTIAFGLALAPALMGTELKLPPAAKPLALVIAPTRELALQVQRELAWLYAPAGGKLAACVGGMEMRHELRALQQGTHIVVGTPGRLIDHLERRSLVLSDLKALVLDEADEMLDMGFRDELERILSDAPKSRRTLLFSATIPPEIEQLAARYQKNAKRIAATPTHTAHVDIEYRAHPIAMREKEHAVVNVLRAHDAASAIVFCKTREDVNHLSANLIERGFAAVAISGELTQNERTRALKAIRDGRARVLVATDVAARGLDLPDLSLVIHADLPNDASVLQHRSGRTGRAGKKGIAVLLVPPAQRRIADAMIRTARIQPVWTPVPSAEQVRTLDETRILKEILALPLEITEEDAAVGQKLLAERTAEQLGGLLSTLFRARMPAAEELPLSVGLPTTARPTRSLPPGNTTFTPRVRTHGAPTATPTAAPAWRPHPTSGGAPIPAAAPRPRVPSTEAPSARPAPASRPAPQGTAPTRPTAPPRARTHEPLAPGGSTWFSINVGRSTNADPKWLVPLICRRGGVTKSDIGAIRIFADETKIEISPAAAERFAKASRMPDRTDPRVQFTPSTAPSGPSAPRPVSGKKRSS